MFERITNFFREIRIDLDFPQYERRCRHEHEQQAQRRFSTKQFDDEKKKLLDTIESKARTNYDDSIDKKKVERGSHEVNAIEIESMLSYFVRNYNQELDDLHAQKDAAGTKKSQLHEKKNEVKELLSDAFGEKDSAYSKLNYYKDRIDSWYAKSDRTPWLFGNAGKKLPTHSMFGQSFGDLDSYKSHRDSAYDDVERSKTKIGHLKQEQDKITNDIKQVKHDIGEIFDRINQAKNDRSRMFELKNDGHNRTELQSRLDGVSLEIRKFSLEIAGLESKRSEYITSEKLRCGVLDLDAKVREIEQKRKQFIDSFELEELKQERRRSHREAWLKQRSMG
ncbi:MAG: hypothetical protein FD134_2743 [Gallionellaceae bacterium]|nr:MAG: hypothetical protein FD134_2743 [Gallionellaceae bacterium]